MNVNYEKLMKCFECVQQKIPFKPEIALILGSGLGDYADTMKLLKRWITTISRASRCRPFRATRDASCSAMRAAFLSLQCRAECISMRATSRRT